MGCPAEVVLENNLVFSICTHDPDTGVLTDADSAPSYRVYEEETETPILTGSMAVLDDANTTGFYTELIACTEANGFETSKTYTIYIEATVDGDTGGIAYGFTVRATSTGTLAGEGAISVDHDYGGTDALAYIVDGGAAVDDAVVQAFLTTDYNAGRRTRNYVKAETRTNAAGRWETEMRLNAGQYTIVFFKQGEYGPDTAVINVS